jgi:hypothetical protein
LLIYSIIVNYLVPIFFIIYFQSFAISNSSNGDF